MIDVKLLQILENSKYSDDDIINHFKIKEEKLALIKRAIKQAKVFAPPNDRHSGQQERGNFISETYGENYSLSREDLGIIFDFRNK